MGKNLNMTLVVGSPPVYSVYVLPVEIKETEHTVKSTFLPLPGEILLVALLILCQDFHSSLYTNKITLALNKTTAYAGR